MKKVLSVLCLAILAGGLMFSSCSKKQFTITVKANNDAWGTVTGGGTYEDGVTATLTATAKEGYEFEKWQDGTTENPRTITVTADETWTAFFKEKAQPTPPTPTNGVSVTFNGTNWTAGDYAGQYYSGQMQDGTPYAGWIVSAAENAESYPMLDMATLTGNNTGSYSGSANTSNGGLGGDFNYVEYYENSYLSDGTYQYGDWWAKSITLNITAFDATSLKVSANANGTMFSALEAFVQSAGAVGVDAASTAPMTETISNVTLETSKKGVVLKHGAKKLVVVR